MNYLTIGLVNFDFWQVKSDELDHLLAYKQFVIGQTDILLS